MGQLHGFRVGMRVRRLRGEPLFPQATVIAATDHQVYCAWGPADRGWVHFLDLAELLQPSTTKPPRRGKRYVRA